MVKKRGCLAGLPLDLWSAPEIWNKVTTWLTYPEHSRQVVTLHALMVMRAGSHPGLTRAIKEADLVIADGFGIAAALSKQGQALESRLPGIVLTRNLLSWCALHQKRVYFYGGSSRLVTKLATVISTTWPDLKVSAIRPGEGEGWPSAAVKEDILIKRPDLLLAGLGTPWQELFIYSLSRENGCHTLAIGVGGSLEVIAGMRPEAPAWVRSKGWEWLFRMICQPARIKSLPQLLKFWWCFLR